MRLELCVVDGAELLSAVCCIGDCEKRTVVARSTNDSWDFSNAYEHTKTHRDLLPDIVLD